MSLSTICIVQSLLKTLWDLYHWRCLYIAVFLLGGVWMVSNLKLCFSATVAERNLWTNVWAQSWETELSTMFLSCTSFLVLFFFFTLFVTFSIFYLILFSVFTEAVSANELKVTHNTSKINIADIAVESGLCIQTVPCEHRPDVSWNAAHLAGYLPCWYLHVLVEWTGHHRHCCDLMLHKILPFTSQMLSRAKLRILIFMRMSFVTLINCKMAALSCFPWAHTHSTNINWACNSVEFCLLMFYLWSDKTAPQQEQKKASWFSNRNTVIVTTVSLGSSRISCCSCTHAPHLLSSP